MRKKLSWIALCLILLPLLLVAGSTLNHRLRLPREAAVFPPPGILVDVGSSRLHVFSAGDGDLALVFLAGSGTSAPVLDFKALYSLLLDEYRIAVVERAGYGWSDLSNAARDLDTVLGETRLALQLAGVRPPYVLVPHSMAGLEALHWANRFPDEVAAIIGLDMAVPQAYERMPLPSDAMLAMLTFAAHTGLTRLVPAVCREAAAIRAGHLNRDEESAYCALFYRRTLTPDMLAEIDAVQDNARLAAAGGIPSAPALFFISDGSQLPVADWQSVLIEYARSYGADYLVLDVGHYLHNEAAAQIAAASRAFIAHSVND